VSHQQTCSVYHPEYLQATGQIQWPLNAFTNRKKLIRVRKAYRKQRQGNLDSDDAEGKK
jgi:hypothetical protein